MAVVLPSNFQRLFSPTEIAWFQSESPSSRPVKTSLTVGGTRRGLPISIKTPTEKGSRRSSVLVRGGADSDRNNVQEEEDEYNLGVKAALSVLRFYKREISPVLPRSCRYVPTCSEYSMEAYKKYGFAKGTVLTTWRICRCNPLGGSGFDPPRWFGEEPPPKE
ncbi:unnamed protein product [Linum trigynum]|uniref:Uncharacterized protein n=1 Tax=Linum trigynum TaxID=586398 RepID=A0AAV2FLC2_9ROSI